MFGNYTEDIPIKIDKTISELSRKEKLLLDDNVNFKEHISTICKKANQKLHALSRISNFMDTDKLRKILRVFIISKFGYCHLI